MKREVMRVLIGDVCVVLLEEGWNEMEIGRVRLVEKMINEWKEIVVFI